MQAVPAPPPRKPQTQPPVWQARSSDIFGKAIEPSFFGKLGAAVMLLGLLCAPIPAAAQQPASQTAVNKGLNGWLFLSSELSFLRAPMFWGDAARGISKSQNPDHADPMVAIEDFHKQLSASGIQLLLMPVPAKARIYSEELDPQDKSSLAPDPFDSFFKQLDSKHIPYIDLRPVLSRSANPKQVTYCKTDSHWSGAGCVLAAQAVAKQLNQSHGALFQKNSRQKFVEKWDQIEAVGDLSVLAPDLNAPKEIIAIRRIWQGNAAVQPDPHSPLLLIGDSHTLVYHDFMAEQSGLLDQLAKETSVVPDLIGTRGSGANAVRVSLLRRSIKDPKYLASKKVVLWCFAAREFTDSDQGWQTIPIQR